MLLFTAWHDDTAENPANPDPGPYVTRGGRRVDEMAHARVGVTDLKEDDFGRLVPEREERERVAART